MHRPNEAPSLAGYRIAVAEDDAAVRRLLKRRLEKSGCADVVECANAKDALSAAHASAPDLLILDGHLGDLTGLQVLTIMRADAGTRDVPVLMISGTPETAGDEAAARALGAAAFFQKPVPWDIVVDAIAAALAVAPRSAAARREGGPVASVLVADDDPIWLDLVHKWVEAAGYRVFPTQDGGKILEMAATLKPDCLIVDYHLRGTTAADICKSLQGSEPVKRIPIIVLTADKELKARALYQGADHFVDKGGGADELLQTLHACVRRKALDAESRSVLERGRIRVEPSTRQVFVAGLPRRVPPKRLELLCLLMREPGGLTLDGLLRHGWDPGTLRKTIQRLKDDLGLPDSIVSTGKGYAVVG